MDFEMDGAAEAGRFQRVLRGFGSPGSPAGNEGGRRREKLDFGTVLSLALTARERLAGAH